MVVSHPCETQRSLAGKNPAGCLLRPCIVGVCPFGWIRNAFNTSTPTPARLPPSAAAVPLSSSMLFDAVCCFVFGNYNYDRTEALDAGEWATTVLMGAAVLPLGVVMRFLPPSVEGDRNFAGYKPRYRHDVFVFDPETKAGGSVRWRV